MTIKKTKSEISESRTEHPSTARSTEKSDIKTVAGNPVKELFGVHIISDADIENHFGSADKEPGDETQEVLSSGKKKTKT